MRILNDLAGTLHTFFGIGNILLKPLGSTNLEVKAAASSSGYATLRIDSLFAYGGQLILTEVGSVPTPMSGQFNLFVNSANHHLSIKNSAGTVIDLQQPPPPASITVKETDGSPNVTNVTEIRVSPGTLTNLTGGAVAIDTAFNLTVSDNTSSFSNIEEIEFTGASVTEPSPGLVNVSIAGAESAPKQEQQPVDLWSPTSALLYLSANYK
jgi:hypothetical protein